MTPRRALGCLVAVAMIMRLAWAACLGLGHDEAYHYLFTLHPDWSYFDHPPMLAMVEAVGLIAAPVVGPIVALRLGFIVLFAGSTILMARLACRFFGAWSGVMAAFVLNATAYYGTAAGTFALPDGPLVFFWLLTLDRMSLALARPYKTWPWVAVGLAWGCAMLSKYHAVFLPAGMLLYLVVEPTARIWLRRPGPYIASVIGLMLFTPVIVWNATHGWASFAFQGHRALGATFRPDRLMAFLGGQALYLLPWIWVFLIGALWRRLRGRQGQPLTLAERFLICQAVVPLGVFLAVSCVRPILPHWSLIGFLALIPLLGSDWARWAQDRPARVRRRLAVLALVPMIGVSVFAIQARWGFLQQGGRGTLGLLPAAYDPSADMYGWDQVVAELRRRGLLDGRSGFLFTSHWYESGQLAFALHDAIPVLCYNPNDAHGFAQWSRPEDWVGRDGILLVVNESSTEPQIYDRWFERIEWLGDFSVMRTGGPIRKISLYRCLHQTQPFPFDGREVAVAEHVPSKRRSR